MSSWLPAWLSSAPPSVGVAITPTSVTAVSLAAGAPRPMVAAIASEPLPEGVVVPSLTAKNVLDPQALSQALSRALARLPGRVRRVALVVPDSVAKISLLRFEKVPPRADDFEKLVRWQVRKAAPFPIDEAQVSATPGVSTADQGREYLVAVTRRNVIEEYEDACRRAGAHAGVVDLASLNLVNLVLFGDRVIGGVLDGDWLLVHVTRESSSIVIVRGEHVILFRNRGSDAADEHLPDLVHQTAMYYEDRLGGQGFSRVIVADGETSVDNAFLQELEGRLRTAAELIDPRRAVTFSDRAQSNDLENIASPVGLVLREMSAA